MLVLFPTSARALLVLLVRMVVLTVVMAASVMLSGWRCLSARVLRLWLVHQVGISGGG